MIKKWEFKFFAMVMLSIVSLPAFSQNPRVQKMSMAPMIPGGLFNMTPTQPNRASPRDSIITAIAQDGFPVVGQASNPNSVATVEVQSNVCHPGHQSQAVSGLFGRGSAQTTGTVFYFDTAGGSLFANNMVLKLNSETTVGGNSGYEAQYSIKFKQADAGLLASFGTGVKVEHDLHAGLYAFENSLSSRKPTISIKTSPLTYLTPSIATELSSAAIANSLNGMRSWIESYVPKAQISALVGKRIRNIQSQSFDLKVLAGYKLSQWTFTNPQYQGLVFTLEKRDFFYPSAKTVFELSYRAKVPSDFRALEGLVDLVVESVSVLSGERLESCGEYESPVAWAMENRR